MPPRLMRIFYFIPRQHFGTIWRCCVCALYIQTLVSTRIFLIDDTNNSFFGIMQSVNSSFVDGFSPGLIFANRISRQDREFCKREHNEMQLNSFCECSKDAACVDSQRVALD